MGAVEACRAPRIVYMAYRTPPIGSIACRARSVVDRAFIVCVVKPKRWST
jgi:hypothetical protein